VHSEGFKGTKKDATAPRARRLQARRHGRHLGHRPHSINILGDFNLARRDLDHPAITTGAWALRCVSCITGDARVEDIRRCHGATLNLVQCSGSMTHLAKMMERDLRHPVQARFLLWNRGHERRALRSRDIFRRRSGHHATRAAIGARRNCGDLSRAANVTSKSSSATKRRSTSAARSRRSR